MGHSRRLAATTDGGSARSAPAGNIPPMSVLVSIPAYAQATIRYLDFGGLLRPTMGGVDQRLNRLGNRFAVDIDLGEMESDAEGRVVRQQIIRAVHEGALIVLPQDGLDTGSAGTPHVNGAGQSGSTLVLAGFSGGYPIRAGQPFSLVDGGRRYVYAVNADVTASISGAATIGITPMLRTSPANGATVEFQTPMLEGNVVGDVSWVYTPGRSQNQTVTIEEAA